MPNDGQKKRPHKAAVFSETSQGSITLLGVFCSVFRGAGSVFRSVGSLVGLVGSVRSGVLRLVSNVAGRGGSSAGSLLGLRSRLTGSVSRGVGLISSLHRFRGRHR